jgi:hypothetical protein
MGWHSVVVINHDMWREAQQDPKKFFEVLNRAMVDEETPGGNYPISSTFEYLGTIHNSDERLRQIRDMLGGRK